MKDHFKDIGHTKIDLTRNSRQGLDEVIFGATKTAEQITSILQVMVDELDCAMATKVSPEKATYISKHIANSVWDESSLVLSVGKHPSKKAGKVHLVSGGTSDGFVVAEAARTLEFFGYEHEVISDVGVAGIHRLLSQLDKIKDCSVIIAFAGMEGALPSVLSGLVDVPVIAVPTSVGSGISEGGKVALDSMLSSCSPGIAVVNIDNGFGAAMFAAKMLNQLSK